jgi:hypothetical protein
MATHQGKEMAMFLEFQQRAKTEQVTLQFAEIKINLLTFMQAQTTTKTLMRVMLPITL